MSVIMRTPILLDQNSTLMTSLNVITSKEALSPNIATLVARDSAYEFGESGVWTQMFNP